MAVRVKAVDRDLPVGRSLVLARRYFGDRAERILAVAERRAGDAGWPSVHGYLVSWNSLRLAVESGVAGKRARDTWSELLIQAGLTNDQPLPF
jgi:hypothetical protein